MNKRNNGPLHGDGQPPRKPRRTRANLSARLNVSSGHFKKRDWQDAVADYFGGEPPINQCILTKGRDLIVAKCVICGRRHNHGWAGELDGELSHRSAHCVPSWPGGYYLQMTPGAGHETRAVGTVGCRVLEVNHLEHPYIEPADGEAAAIAPTAYSETSGDEEAA